MHMSAKVAAQFAQLGAQYHTVEHVHQRVQLAEAVLDHIVHNRPGQK